MKGFCSLCNRQFRYACLLVTHKRKWHKNEMELYKIDPGKLEATFTCNLCPESFLTQNILNYHTRVKHSLDERKRAQQCSLCEETFEWSNTRKVKMRAHMKNVHGVKNEISSGDVDQTSSALKEEKCDEADNDEQWTGIAVSDPYLP